ncbi:MAG: GMP synthase (glutamine-hydrolyzing) [Thelocarpon superellum]|nr:MAG: GMP synthase (glutamine-hydrolyzing) [Thelocarpon superellum]
MGAAPELMEAPAKTFDTILVLDFGSQYSHLITRRLRELNVYSEMLPCTQKVADLGWTPKGVILSGGPYSVYEEGAPHVDPAFFEMDVPVLGICYGLQEIAWHHGRNVLAGEKREYGQATIKVERHGADSHVDRLFHGLESDIQVWMSHGDKLAQLPPSFHTIATTANAPFAGIAHDTRSLYGIQFHPEVTHTPRGTELLRNFAVEICRARQDWTMGKFVDQELARIRALVGGKGQVIGAVSGGVDSTVAAKLMQEAIGDRFHAVLVDNGVLRLNEAQTVHERLTKHLGINLTVVDASARFLGLLRGVSDPETKRKIIGNTFVEVFQETAKQMTAAAAGSAREGEIEWLLQGTLYPDVIESISFKGPSATIKTHHNVGGLLKGMHLKLIEPLRELFKDEVRALGTTLGIAEDLVWRHPFPGPGLAVRILGEVTPEQVRIARQADHIFLEEIRAAGLYRQISQAFAALLPVKAVGVMGDKRVHEQVIALRAVETTDFMTADWFPFDGHFLKRVSTRIVNEVNGVCRVVYDVPTVKVEGSDFVNPSTGDRLQIVGVAYQPGGQSAYSPGNDPLSDGDACLRDAALLQTLGVNAIRVYNLDPSINHDLCASIFNGVGIYMLLDVNSPLGGESLNRGDPGSTYTSDYLKRIFGVVEAFKGYPNTLAFFAGNEVINDKPSSQVVPPYLRAVQRDLKNYIAKHANRTIPVGYSAADVESLRTSTWEYLQCAIDGSSSDASRADFFALNSYSWCGPTATYQSSGYSTLISDFSNTSIPVFFSEYGCNAVVPRTFDEVQALYGTQVTPVMSGGLVYQYTEDVSNYGLVNVSSNGSAQLRTDYDDLQTQYAKLNLTLLQSTPPSSTKPSVPSCDASLITAPGFNSSFDIPAVPSGGQDLINNGLDNPHQGKLVPVTNTNVTQQVEDSKGNVLTGLHIRLLPDDESNSPNPNATTGTQSTASPSPTAKKNAGSSLRMSTRDGASAGAGLLRAVLIATGSVLFGSILVL